MVRLKNRYVLSQIHVSPDLCPPKKYKFSQFDVYNSVQQTLREVHGDLGAARLQRSLGVKYINEDTMIVMIRTRRGTHEQLMQALSFIRKICGQDVLFQTLHLAGSMRSCHKYLTSYHRTELVRLRRACADPDQRRQIRERINQLDEAQRAKREAKRGKHDRAEQMLLGDSSDSE